MKHLKDYITDNKIDILDKQFIQHINIHEAFTVPYIYYTFEGIGLFSGCKEIIQYCDKYFLNIFGFGTAENTVTIESSNIKEGLFFDKLILHFCINDKKKFYEEYKIGYINDDKNDSYENNKWDIKNQKFNFIEIDIYNINLTNNVCDVLELLTHELTHAYNDYCLHKKDKSLRNTTVSNNFKKELKQISDNIKLKSTIDFKNINIYNKYLNEDIPYIEELLYYLEKTKINAYIAQINQVLKGKDFCTGQEAVDYLNNNSVTYVNYKYLYNLFNDNSYTDLLLNLGFKQSTINKFRQITQHTWNKIINHIYNILEDNGYLKEDALLRIDQVLTKIWDR